MSARRVNLIPMAGEGRRFSEAGYRVPKPLIDIQGRAMFLRAADSLPPADHWIFICRSEHLDRYGAAEWILANYPDCTMIRLDHLTDGQLCTCLLAEPYLREDDILQIGACDNGMRYDHRAYAQWVRDAPSDILIWTFMGNPAVRENPAMYGWVEVDPQDSVRRVSCKVPISDTPEADPAIIGAFTFRRASDFLRIARRCIAEERRINGEFYLDEAMNVALADGLRVAVFTVDQYVCWGTPRELEQHLRQSPDRAGHA